jgi:hypothetical protein
MLLDGIESYAESNKELKTILLENIIKIHPKWQLDKEKDIEANKLLIMARNPVYPALKPIWLLESGKIYSINGAAKTLTPDFQFLFQFTYDIDAMEAIEILERNRPYKSKTSKPTSSWNTPQQGLDVLKAQRYITENEALIMKKLDEYIDDPKNPDSKEAIEKWAKQNNISSSRIKEIDIMRYYKNIDGIKRDGYVRVGEKKQNKEIGKPTGALIKVFRVSFKKTNTDVYIQVETDLPDGAPLMCSIGKTGLRGSDRWIDKQAEITVRNGKAEAKIPLKNYNGERLEKGSYDLSILFNSFWSAFQKDVDPNVKLKVGEFGENINTPYDSTYTNRGKIYKTIKYKKQKAFSVQ